MTHDGTHLVFTIHPPEDTVKAMRRRKVKKDDLPTDTLGIYALRTRMLQTVPDLIKVTVPDKWAGTIAYQVDPQAPPADSTDKAEKKKGKSYSKKNGYPLVLRTLATGRQDTLDYVTDYTVATAGRGVAAISTGRDSTLHPGVYALAGNDNEWRLIKAQQGKYQKLGFDHTGTQLAFIGDVDTTEARVRPFALYHWKRGQDSAMIMADNGMDFVPEGWLISEHAGINFSKDGGRLFFGLAPEPMLEDTTLLDEEIPGVEVWHYQDERLYTQQSVRARRERERSFLAVADLANGSMQLISNETLPEDRLDPDRNSPHVILYREDPYLREMSWTGVTKRDVYVHHLKDHTRTKLIEGTDGNPRLSPGFNYVYWYSRSKGVWEISSVDGSARRTTRSIPVSLSNELHDQPSDPWPYGMAGWTKGDERMLIYDRYDIWSVPTTGRAPAVNLTNGRASKTQYRYISLDPDERAIDPDTPMLLYVFNEETRASGYAQLDLNTGQLRPLIMADARFTNRPRKARDADVVLFTRETFREFRDLHLTSDWFQSSTRISDMNPQQADYRWGTAEVYTWTAFDGQEIDGLLFKPDGFDPGKQYPMIVNFYERSSNGLHNHRAPFPHRSTINYSFYVSRGYVIFNPDIPYKIGYPGESAYNAVVSGTQALIDEGFIDPDRIGVQGHSWGGYQIADLLTRTDIFACAEAGAPVVNMISAYGGIRWQTGLSRMFQYEMTQSRLGATLWEKPELYLENSPIFNLDKINTPVLIMHNDSDGHVPWYQGIEFFVAMRRLGKPAWMLNYNGEPHWPLKLQNRKDFNVRMQQFFDHYLMDKPMPVWMKEGIPATDKGIRDGYELINRG